MLEAFPLARCAILCAALVTSCAPRNSDPNSGASAPKDASAIVACRDFANAISDSQKGLITNEELLVQIRNVYGNARLARSDKLKIAGETMLREVTSGTTEGGLRAFKAFADACLENQ